MAMERLYLKSGKGPVGPVGLALLRNWAEAGRLSPEAPVSPDGRRWRRAADHPPLARHFVPDAKAGALEESLGFPARRIPVRHAAEPTDFLAWRAAVAEPGPRVAVAFHAAISAAVLLSMYASYAALLLIGKALFPTMSWLELGLFSLPVCVLVGIAAGQPAGAWALGRTLGLDRDHRRAFALRLGWSRKPSSWPGWLGRWLFTGDWLRDPRGCADLPFVRVFVAGPPAERCVDELAIWNEVFREIAGRDHAESERTRCEIAYVERLPDWAPRAVRGFGLEDLDEVIGAPAKVWAKHFWSKACESVPELGLGGRVQEKAFRFHHLRLPDGREALAITLRSASGALPQSAASRVFAAEAA
jgi:hypothetical protein